MTPNSSSRLPPSIHSIAPVLVQPSTVLSDWQLLQVRRSQGRRTRHLVGRADGEGRVCSALASIDLISLTAVSSSGRIYLLVGPPGHDLDADYVWFAWMHATQSSHARVMTRALLKLRSQRGRAQLEDP